MRKTRFKLDPVAGVRFAYSPMMDVATSYRALHQPKYATNQFQWVEEAHQALYGVELPYLDAVVPPDEYMADFVTPPPDTPTHDLDGEIERLRATDIEVIRQNMLQILDLNDLTPARQHLLTEPGIAVACLITDVQVYWRLVIAPHWERMRVVLENDVLFHAREQALNGQAHMLKGLGSRLSVEGEWLVIGYDDEKPCAQDFDLTGYPFVLTPSVFSPEHHPLYQVHPAWNPMLIYGARGNGTWRVPTAPPDAEEALQAMMGAGRARVIEALRQPASTGELAQHLAITSGAVSQHLNRLGQAGLVESHRSGHRVYYRLSRRGQKLVDLFIES